MKNQKLMLVIIRIFVSRTIIKKIQSIQEELSRQSKRIVITVNWAVLSYGGHRVPSSSSLNGFGGILEWEGVETKKNQIGVENRSFVVFP
jgi:hypothetical protein